MTVLIMYFCCGSVCFMFKGLFCVARSFYVRLISQWGGGGGGGTLRFLLYEPQHLLFTPKNIGSNGLPPKILGSFSIPPKISNISEKH